MTETLATPRRERPRTTYAVLDTDIHPHAPAQAILPRLAGPHRRRFETFGSRVPGPPD